MTFRNTGKRDSGNTVSRDSAYLSANDGLLIPACSADKSIVIYDVLSYGSGKLGTAVDGGGTQLCFINAGQNHFGISVIVPAGQGVYTNTSSGNMTITYAIVDGLPASLITNVVSGGGGTTTTTADPGPAAELCAAGAVNSDTTLQQFINGTYALEGSLFNGKAWYKKDVLGSTAIIAWYSATNDWQFQWYDDITSTWTIAYTSTEDVGRPENVSSWTQAAGGWGAGISVVRSQCASANQEGPPRAADPMCVANAYHSSYPSAGSNGELAIYINGDYDLQATWYNDKVWYQKADGMGRIRWNGVSQWRAEWYDVTTNPGNPVWRLAFYAIDYATTPYLLPAGSWQDNANGWDDSYGSVDMVATSSTCPTTTTTAAPTTTTAAPTTTTAAPTTTTAAATTTTTTAAGSYFRVEDCNDPGVYYIIDDTMTYAPNVSEVVHWMDTNYDSHCGTVTATGVGGTSVGDIQDVDDGFTAYDCSSCGTTNL